ncbi:hypothetical protein TNCV_2141541 [Trichonephila clavipes]|uniref:Uncharacterized protein n=1 Tax=Trichonephila clavipes TaxID=2585209 RepID=A0A8X6S0L1_TRICX|nr:hypothetical protein TNCV_2141541 [Trichonephila clavipes]
MNETTQQEKTTQLGSRNETTQLVSRNETTQLCTAVDRLQPPTTPATACNRLRPPTTAYNRLQPPATAYNRLQPPATACTACTACTAFTAESAFSTYSRMKQSLTCSLSVNGLPFFAISSDTAKLVRLTVSCKLRPVT